jgi:hypothetical protein
LEGLAGFATAEMCISIEQWQHRDNAKGEHGIKFLLVK